MWLFVRSILRCAQVIQRTARTFEPVQADERFVLRVRVDVTLPPLMALLRILDELDRAGVRHRCLPIGV